MASKRSTEPGKLAKGYLFVYNILQVFGWSYLLLMITKYYYSPEVGSASLWESVKPIVIIFKMLRYWRSLLYTISIMTSLSSLLLCLDSLTLFSFPKANITRYLLLYFVFCKLLQGLILHAATGIVPSSVVITTFQVFSRVMMVCGVLLPTPTGPASPGLPLALVAWSITEIIRYLYYALNLVGLLPYLLAWCRYSLFVVLYPIGVTGELLCFYAAQAHVARTKMWTVEMPNKLNFTFSYHYLLLFIMFLYIPLFPQMYLHMFAQRRKILGESSKKTQ